MAAASAAAQQIPLQILVTQSGNAVRVQNGATLAFSAPVGQSQAAQIRATYSGAGQIMITELPAVFGSAAFKANFSANLPLTLNPGGSISFDVEFVPSNA